MGIQFKILVFPVYFEFISHQSTLAIIIRSASLNKRKMEHCRHISRLKDYNSVDRFVVEFSNYSKSCYILQFVTSNRDRIDA